MKKAKAIILFSGGLDSTTLLYWAKAQNFEPVTLSFRYNQRHSIELEFVKKLATLAQVQEKYILDLDTSLFGNSALTSHTKVPMGGSDLDQEDLIPATYVPARNLVFLSLATALAESIQSQDIFIGVNALDYSGYPDCRPDFISAFEQTAQLATQAGRQGLGVTIHAPLLAMSKAEIVHKAFELNVPLQYTWSCYHPVLQKDIPIPCGECDACILRARGFLQAGKTDPSL